MMLDTIRDIAVYIILAGVLVTGSYLLRVHKNDMLRLLTELIQKAENTITGSGMGAEKKAIVLEQLRIMGIKLTDWIDFAIDDIVAQLNEKSAWLTDAAARKAGEEHE